MYKKSLFQNLSKIQKGNLTSFLKNFITKKKRSDSEFLLEEFIEEQNYYIEIGQPYFCWISEILDKEEFLNDLKICIKEIVYTNEQKERQKPYIEKQKIFAKEQRKKAQEYKMSKEEPSKKQISYYKSLCKKKGLKLPDFETLSKLDLKNMISDILEENQTC